VVALTDATGVLIDTIRYDAFGKVVSESNPAVGDRWKAFGYQYDAALGMSYDLARWYDPVTGRFIQEDPLGLQAGDSNEMRYVGNDPTNGIDPTGLYRLKERSTEDPNKVGLVYVKSWLNRVVTGGDSYGVYVGTYDKTTGRVVRNGYEVPIDTVRAMIAGWVNETHSELNNWFKENDYRGQDVVAAMANPNTPTAGAGGNTTAGSLINSVSQPTFFDNNRAGATQINALARGYVEGAPIIAGALVTPSTSAARIFAQRGASGAPLASAPKVYPKTPPRGQRPPTVEKIGNAYPKGSRWAGRTYEFQGVTDPVVQASMRAKYPNGVQFNEKGFPDFSPYRYKGGRGQLNDVQIEMSGSYRQDFIRANRAAGFESTPDGYVWHHHQDMGRMQLVPEDIHIHTRHSGGVDIWQKANGLEYTR
jgi:RHS repeat-associated protein